MQSQLDSPRAAPAPASRGVMMRDVSHRPSAISSSAGLTSADEEKEITADVSSSPASARTRAPCRGEWEVFRFLPRFWQRYPSTRFRDPALTERDLYELWSDHVFVAATRRFAENQCANADEWATLCFASAMVKAAKRSRREGRTDPMGHFLFMLEGGDREKRDDRGNVVVARRQLDDRATLNLDELRAGLLGKYGLSLEELLDQPRREAASVEPVSAHTAHRVASAAVAAVVAGSLAAAPQPPAPHAPATGRSVASWLKEREGGLSIKPQPAPKELSPERLLELARLARLYAESAVVSGTPDRDWLVDHRTRDLSKAFARAALEAEGASGVIARDTPHA